MPLGTRERNKTRPGLLRFERQLFFVHAQLSPPQRVLQATSESTRWAKVGRDRRKGSSNQFKGSLNGFCSNTKIARLLLYGTGTSQETTPQGLKLRCNVVSEQFQSGPSYLFLFRVIERGCWVQNGLLGIVEQLRDVLQVLRRTLEQKKRGVDVRNVGQEATKKEGHHPSPPDLQPGFQMGNLLRLTQVRASIHKAGTLPLS